MVAIIGLRSHTHFAKANDTITKLNLDRNTIGDAGAIALAESLKAMIVTCVLQVRVSLFLWQVCAHIHRRNSNCEAVTAISQFCQGTVATSADALSSGWVREEPVGLAGRWKCTQALFSAELNQSKRNQHTRRIEVASCHVCARSALLVLRANNNFDTRLCGLCCMVQEKHSLMTDCCVTNEASTSRARCLFVFMTSSTCHAATPQGPDRKAVSMFVGFQVAHHALNR